MLPLGFVGFSIIVTLMYGILFKKISGFCALILVPIVYALISGFGPELGLFMMNGVKTIFPTATMMLFAVIYFGIMVDVGLFDGLIVRLLNTVNGDPLKVILGTVFLAMVASLEGEGAIVFMIVCTALLPLYTKLRINPVILAIICIMDTAVKNLFPWSAPSARVLSVLHVEPASIFHPLIPVIIAGYAWVILAAYVMGKRERQRLGVIHIDPAILDRMALESIANDSNTKRPQLFWINLGLTALVFLSLFTSFLPVAITFMIGTALGLVINYPSLEAQQTHLLRHANEAFSVTAVVFAAGILMGILTETKMTHAMAECILSLIPSNGGKHLGFITALLSSPLSFLLSNDGFYFGVLPILSNMAETSGIPIEQIGIASLLGTPLHMLSPLVAALWLLVGMCKITFSDLQTAGIWWCLGLTLLNIAVALLFGIIHVTNG